MKLMKALGEMPGVFYEHVFGIREDTSKCKVKSKGVCVGRHQVGDFMRAMVAVVLLPWTSGMSSTRPPVASTTLAPTTRSLV